MVVELGYQILIWNKLKVIGKLILDSIEMSNEFFYSGFCNSNGNICVYDCLIFGASPSYVKKLIYPSVCTVCTVWCDIFFLPYVIYEFTFLFDQMYSFTLSDGHREIFSFHNCYEVHTLLFNIHSWYVFTTY